MAIVNAKEMLLKATEEKYAVGAFNCTNLVQMEAVIEAAVSLKAPLILQTSVAPSKFLNPQVIPDQPEKVARQSRKECQSFKDIF